VSKNTLWTQVLVLVVSRIDYSGWPASYTERRTLLPG